MAFAPSPQTDMPLSPPLTPGKDTDLPPVASGEAVPIAAIPAGSAARKPKDGIVFYLKIALFLVLFLTVTLSILSMQFPSLLLLFHSHRLYRGYIRITEKIFGSLIIVLVHTFTPGTKLILTGDYDKLKADEKYVLISNHQIYPDWIYLWTLAWQW